MVKDVSARVDALVAVAVFVARIGQITVPVGRSQYPDGRNSMEATSSTTVYSPSQYDICELSFYCYPRRPQLSHYILWPDFRCHEREVRVGPLLAEGGLGDSGGKPINSVGFVHLLLVGTLKDAANLSHTGPLFHPANQLPFQRAR